MRWWWIVIFIVVWALLVFLTSSYPKFPEWIAITGSVLLSLLYVADPLRRFFKHEFNTASLALWFFVTFIVVLFEFKIRNRENLISYGGWSKPLAVLFAALLVFSQYVYPHLKASWGGGTPANVTIYFTKDSMISPDGNAQAQLIEESDDGFYIVGVAEPKAVFVPRSAVALIYFADKPTDSTILRQHLKGNKP